MKAWLFSILALFGTVINNRVGDPQNGLDEFLKKRGFFLSPTHSEYNEGYSSKEQRSCFVEDLSQFPVNSKVLEIGFNAGHSAEAFLSSPNCAKLVSIDLNTHPYTRVGVEFMKGKFPDRFEFLEGNSLLKVSQYAIEHPKETFDLIFIDGGHSFDNCIGDIRNSRSLAHANTFLWIDDYVSYGVKEAVDYCVEQGIITLLWVKSTVGKDPEGERTWVIARYLTQCEQVFTDIYTKGIWGKDCYGKGISGPGSTWPEGKPFVDYVQRFLDSKNSKEVFSVVDVGCGDWVLSREIDWGDRHYLGIDVSGELIAKNQSDFGNNRIHFQQLDAVVHDIPMGDVVLCKDVMIHLPNQMIQDLLSKFKCFKYAILVNDFPSLQEVNINRDILLGSFHPLDLMAPPFNLKPKEVLYYFSGSQLKQILLLQS